MTAPVGDIMAPAGDMQAEWVEQVEEQAVVAAAVAVDRRVRGVVPHCLPENSLPPVPARQ